MAGENILPYKVAAHRHTPEIEEQLALLGAPALTRAVPGAPRAARPGRAGQLLRHAHARRSAPTSCASCSPTPTRDEPFVEVVDAPPGVREVRETNFCRMFAAADAHTGKVLVFSAIDNLWKGTSSQAVQNLNLMFGLPETRGCVSGMPSDATRPFFHSRWVPAPAHVRELGARRRAARGLSRGRASPRGSSRAATPTSACSCATPSEPVERGALHRHRHARGAGAASAASAAASTRCARCSSNSGCANAATGRRGLDDAAKTQGAAALAVGVDPRRGRARLDRRRSATTCPSTRCSRASSRRARSCAATATRAFQQAIQTTDAFEKRANLEVELPSGDGAAERAVQGRGHDLAALRDDALLRRRPTPRSSAETADLLLGVCVKRSFDRASVDGQLSTNDTAILMCSGASGVQRRARERGRAALRRGARRAAAPARDHDGRRRRGRRSGSRRVVVRGGNADGVEAAARAVANSPLVKTALHGGDPNWGRIVQAVGGALPGTAPLRDRHLDRGHRRCARRARRSDYDEAALAAAVQRRGGRVRDRRCPARAPRPRSSSPISRTST